MKNEFSTTYNYAQIDFAATGISEDIVAPNGYFGRVEEIVVKNVTEIFSAIDDPPGVGVSDGQNDESFGQIPSGDMDGLAVGATLQADLLQQRNTIGKGVTFSIDLFGDSNGAATGIADVAITIRWFK